MQYSREKFLGALTLGRVLRYTIVAGLGALYGNQIVRFFSRYDKMAVAILVALACVGAAVSIIQYYRWKRTSSMPAPSNS
jgi:membrane protein DedA with SNARE-associated domain